MDDIIQAMKKKKEEEEIKSLKLYFRKESEIKDLGELNSFRNWSCQIKKGIFIS